MSLDEFRHEFLTYVNQSIEAKYQTYATYTQDPQLFDMLMHARKLIASGKCIRPYLAYTMYLACGGPSNSRVIDALVSLELFHTFALIHDDIIDEGTTRHGNLTVHEYVKQYLSQTEREISNPIHHAHSQAILVGDLLFSWAL
ncbi:MAG: polyprenyl synthetase family protein, partial [Candidatus Paceibacteria bacterium]